VGGFFKVSGAVIRRVSGLGIFTVSFGPVLIDGLSGKVSFTLSVLINGIKSESRGRLIEWGMT